MIWPVPNTDHFELTEYLFGTEATNEFYDEDINNFIKSGAQ